MKKFAVIGLGVFGVSLAKSLTEKGAEVIAIDRDMSRVEHIQDYVSIAVRLDSTDMTALQSQGIHEVDIAVVCIGEDFESNLLTAVLLKQMGVPKVIARATRPIEEKIIRSVGIDQVILPEQEVGEKLAYSLMHPRLHDILYMTKDYTITEVETPKSFIGKSLEELNLRAKFGLNAVIVKRIREETAENGVLQRKENVIMPHAGTVIESGDILVIIGKKNDMNKLLSTD